jgi:hypothetical protein
LLAREKAKIHRSHERVFNGLLVDIYTMCIVPPLHGFCVFMDVSMTSILKFTVPVNLRLLVREKTKMRRSDNNESVRIVPVTTYSEQYMRR